MFIKRIAYTPDLAYGRVPSWVIDILKKEKTITYVAADDYNGIFGAVIYTLSPIDKSEVNLRYIFVEDEVKKIGIATELMNQSIARLKKRGITAINCRVFGDEMKQDLMFNLLLKSRFIPLTYGGHFLKYSLAELKQSFLAQQKDKLQAAMKNVKFFNEIPDHDKKAFLVKATDKSILFDFDSIDLLFSSFYVEKSEIVGYMNLKEVEENMILLSDLYVENGVNAPLVITSMLATMLKVSSSVMPDDTQFYFQVYQDNEFNGFITAFGKRDYNIEISEYYRVLNAD